MDETDSIRHIAVTIIGILAVCGIIGNSLVLYVFTRQKQKLSSTIFILTLAGTDLFTSMVTMPYTMAVEMLKYDVGHDALCKIYHILMTTTIPFSASVMVAIAVDRYLCIVHPFKNTMTLPRAKISVCVLAIASCCLSLPLSLSYGTYKRENITEDIFQMIDSKHHDANSSFSALLIQAVVSNMTYHDGLHSNKTENNTHVYFVRETICFKNLLLVSKDVFNVFQKVYSAYFAVCAVIVIILYLIIYRSVLRRRRKRLHLSNSCCGFLGPINVPNVENNDHEQTEFTMLNHTGKDKDKSPVSRNQRDESFKLEPHDKSAQNGSKQDTKDKASSTSDKESLMRPSGVSRAKLEKLRMANTKTAICLSVVAVTYIAAFLPAWLMALNVIAMNPIIFYLYFTYNVANPIIYAFLNPSFRNDLQALLKC